MLKRRLLVVGAGDIGRRVMLALGQRYRIYALVRSSAAAAALRKMDVIPIEGDLDDRPSLNRLRGIGEDLLHFAPPPAQGRVDTRTRHLLAALGKGSILPQRLVYISTSGIYGDCGGAWVDECRPPCPQTERAWRRLNAEQQLRHFGKRYGVRVAILRVPGIYSSSRLPLERLQNRVPVFFDTEDGYTNHIHADDLAHSAIAALFHARALRAYHVADESGLKLGAYLDLVADRFGLPRPPRLPRDIAEQTIGAARLSFMRESRRLSNLRLKHELGVVLQYPDVGAFLTALKPERTPHSADRAGFSDCAIRPT